MILSAGYDAHRDDPLTDLGLSSGDFGDLTADLVELVPAGRRLAFLEGGYDLTAVAHSSAATVSALLGEPDPPRGADVGRAGRHRGGTCGARPRAARHGLRWVPVPPGPPGSLGP